MMIQCNNSFLLNKINKQKKDKIVGFKKQKKNNSSQNKNKKRWKKLQNKSLWSSNSIIVKLNNKLNITQTLH